MKWIPSNRLSVYGYLRDPIFKKTPVTNYLLTRYTYLCVYGGVELVTVICLGAEHGLRLLTCYSVHHHISGTCRHLSLYKIGLTPRKTGAQFHKNYLYLKFVRFIDAPRSWITERGKVWRVTSEDFIGNLWKKDYMVCFSGDLILL